MVLLHDFFLEKEQYSLCEQRAIFFQKKNGRSLNYRSLWLWKVSCGMQEIPTMSSKRLDLNGMS